MRALGNILWHIPFLGFLNALFVFLLGLLLTALVITAPIGLGLLQYAKFLLLPYSYEMVPSSSIKKSDNGLWESFSFIIRLIYFPIGLVLAFIQILQTIPLFCTILGMPIAIVLAKSVHVYFNPVGKICVSRNVAEAMEAQRGAEELKKLQEQ